MTKYSIERSRFGWWFAYNPNEPVGTFDSYSVTRAWTKERLVRKLERRAAKWARRERNRQRHDVEISADD